MAKARFRLKQYVLGFRAGDEVVGIRATTDQGHPAIDVVGEGEPTIWVSYLHPLNEAARKMIQKGSEANNGKESNNGG